MRRTMEWMRISGFAAVIALMTGCSVNSTFVYKPSPSSADARKLPVKVAVLPFVDGTENFTKRGSVLGDGQFNLAKTGYAGTITALPPEFWGKSFADELAASGGFQSARFVYSPSEVREDETYLVGGTLKKVIFASTFDYPNMLLVSFRAERRSGGKKVWGKEIGKEWKTPTSVNIDCGMAIQCRINGLHADWNKWIAAMLSEARADLVATLASLENGGGDAAGTKTGPGAGESVERTIDRILQGK